jgi:hypothetical protein
MMVLLLYPIFHYSIIPEPFLQNVNAEIILTCHVKSILDTNERFLLLQCRCQKFGRPLQFHFNTQILTFKHIIINPYTLLI